MPKAKQKNPRQDVDLARAQYEYSLKLFEREQERRKNLENKAQFHLTLILAFLGALFLKLDALELLKNIIIGGTMPLPLVWSLYICGGIFAASLLAALVGVLLTIKARAYKSEYLPQLRTNLFDESFGYIDPYNAAGLFTNTAITYLLALDDHKKNNDAKAGWLYLTSYSLLVAVAAFALIFGVISFSLLAQ